jgi:hypothetical protein
MTLLYRREGNSNHSSYCKCRLNIKVADLQKINPNKNTLQKVTDLLFERQLIIGHAYPSSDLLLHPFNFTKNAIFQLDAKQLDLKRYLQWS